MLPTRGNTGASSLGMGGISNQLSAKRVIHVILDESSEFFNGYKSIGTIFFEDPYDRLSNRPGVRTINQQNKALPITPNNQFYPIVGELIFVTPVRNPVGDSIMNFYFPPIRIQNQSAHNAAHTKYNTGHQSTKEKRNRAQEGIANKQPGNEDWSFYYGDYYEERDIRRLLPFEGDYLLEGRHGNSIRFGSTTPYSSDTEGPYPNPWSIDSLDNEEAQIGDPITIIRNGQKVVEKDLDKLTNYLEDINEDDSSIYMCSNQRLSNLKVAGSASPVDQGSYIADPEVSEQTSDTGTKLLIMHDLTLAFLKTNPGGYLGVTQLEYVRDELLDLPSPEEMAFTINQAGSPNETQEPATAINLTTTSSVFAEQETDDGLSFFDEMVGSGAVDADDFFEVSHTYENVNISSTILTTEQEIDNVRGSGENEIEEPNSYPCTIPHIDEDGFAVELHKPITSKKMASRIKGLDPASVINPATNLKGRKHLCIHTTAGDFTHISLAMFFLQTRAWKRHGYHITIDRDGSCVETYHNNDSFNGNTWGVGEAGNKNNFSHKLNYPGGINNQDTFNIVWLGGASNLDMTKEQAVAIRDITKAVISLNPDIKIVGHNQFTDKSCPRFYVPAWCKNLNGGDIPSKNILEFSTFSGHKSALNPNGGNFNNYGNQTHSYQDKRKKRDEDGEVIEKLDDYGHYYPVYENYTRTVNLSIIHDRAKGDSKLTKNAVKVAKMSIGAE